MEEGIGCSQRDVANAFKRFLIGQFIKFFLLIDSSSKAFIARLLLVFIIRSYINLRLP